MPPTVNVPSLWVNSIICCGMWVGYAAVILVGLPFSSGIMSPSWSWPNVVHFHVRPARSVTYWPSGVLFVCVTCVLPHPFVCARSWRASVSCLARFPGAHLVLCVNSLRAVVVGVAAIFTW